MRRFKNFDEFDKHHPNIANAMRASSDNDFVKSMYQKIEAGEGLSRKQFEALLKFQPPTVKLGKGDEFALIVDVTKYSEKGLDFWDPESRVRGRINWPESDVYEELFDTDFRKAIDDEVLHTVLLTAKVEWTPPKDPGAFLIVEATSAETRNPRGNYVTEAKKFASLLADDESWERPAATAATGELPTVSHKSGAAQIVEGTLFFGALELVNHAKNTDKFWNIAVEQVRPASGHYPAQQFRMRRHYGRNGSDGTEQSNMFDTYSGAVKEATRLWDSKIAKGYKSKQVFGSLEAETFDEAIEDGVFAPETHYDKRTKKIVVFEVPAAKRVHESREAEDRVSFAPTPEPEPEVPEAVRGLLPAFAGWQEGWD